MKLSSIFRLLVLCFSLVYLSSCSKDEPIEPVIEETPTSAEIAIDSGTVGLVINTRDIAKKGYKPSKADVSFSGDYASFSAILDINAATQVAYLRINVKDLTSDELNGFQEGLPIIITITNNTGTELSSLSLTKQVVDASNIPVILDTDLPKKNPPLALNPEALFIIQSELDGDVLTLAYPQDGPGNGHLYTEPFEMDNSKRQLFYFKPVPGEGDSVYYFLTDRGYVHALNGSGFYRETDISYEGGELTESHQLVVSIDGEGWVKLRPKNGNYLWKDAELEEFIEGESGKYLRFRILNGAVEWSMLSQGTSFDQPLLPPAHLDFAYSATLINCSPATLTESVGRSESRSQTITSGFEESVELFSSDEGRVDVTAGVEVEASFFGNGASASLEVSSGYTYTTSTTQSSTNTWEESSTSEIEISRIRDLELTPNTAVEVYDAVQTLSNVKVPYTKHFRLRGKDQNGEFLKGSEIGFQLFSNHFDGVISEVGEDYIDFTIKGTTSIDRMMQVETRVAELPGVCN